jgi:Spy/CpxP family protein refolding chaperone
MANLRESMWALLLGGAAILVAAIVGSAHSGYLGPTSVQGPPPGGPGGPPGGMDMRLLLQLDLTDAQQQQIKALLDQQRTDLQPYQEQLWQAREAMQAAVEADTFDEAVVRGLAVSEGQATTELSVIRARTQAAISRLLTTEQRAKLAELRQQRRPPAP